MSQIVSKSNLMTLKRQYMANVNNTFHNCSKSMCAQYQLPKTIFVFFIFFIEKAPIYKLTSLKGNQNRVLFPSTLIIRIILNKKTEEKKKQELQIS